MRFRLLAVLVVALLSVLVPTRPASAATSFNVAAQGMSSYLIDGAANPTLTLTKGQTYTFNINVSVGMPHPFWITTARGAGDVSSNAFGVGVTGNGASPGTVTFTVPTSAPATLFYQCSFHDPMGGTLNAGFAAWPMDVYVRFSDVAFGFRRLESRLSARADDARPRRAGARGLALRVNGGGCARRAPGARAGARDGRRRGDVGARG